MILKVLFFGATAQATGSREIEFSTDESSTPVILVERLRISYPALTNQRLLIAVNENYVDADVMLKEGDEVAVFTAVSGG